MQATTTGRLLDCYPDYHQDITPLKFQFPFQELSFHIGTRTPFFHATMALKLFRGSLLSCTSSERGKEILLHSFITILLLQHGTTWNPYYYVHYCLVVVTLILDRNLIFTTLPSHLPSPGVEKGSLLGVLLKCNPSSDYLFKCNLKIVSQQQTNNCW